MAKLPLSDVLHRGFVFSLAALSAYGLFLGIAVHRETMEKGRQVSYSIFRPNEYAVMAKMEKDAERERETEAKEHALADAAQSAFKPKSS